MHIYRSSGVLANPSSGVLATLARTSLERRENENFSTPKLGENSEIVRIKKFGAPNTDRGVQVGHVIPPPCGGGIPLFFSF